MSRPRSVISAGTHATAAHLAHTEEIFGAVGKTPLVPGQNIKPGKHTFWITAEGYDEYTETIDIAPGDGGLSALTLRPSTPPHNPAYFAAEPSPINDDFRLMDFVDDGDGQIWVLLRENVIHAGGD